MRNFGTLVGPISLPTLGGTTPDGLLGADILSSFEVDLALPHGLLRLYDGSACPIPGPPWGQPYTVIPANRSLHDRLFFRVMVDGHGLAAIFDSGSPHTAIDEASALAAGVDAQLLGRDPGKTIHGITAGAAGSHLHRFGQLVIGNDTLTNPVLIVAELGLIDADMMLGTDYLRSRRVWLSYGSHRIFLGHAS